MNTPRPPLTGLILAGGAGRRMGGVDKGWVEWRGRPMIEWVMERLAPQVTALAISANRSLNRYAALGVPVVTDLRPDYPGPLAGIEAGLRTAPTGFVLCAPCDSPELPPDLGQRLLAALEPGQHAAVVTLEDIPQPVFALLHTQLAASLAAFLDGGGRRVGAWLEAVGARPVAFDDVAGSLANRNTPEQMAG